MPSNFPSTGTNKGVTMKEETVKTASLSLHFENEELEGAFREHYATSHRSRLKFLCVAVVVATVVQLILDVIDEFDLLAVILRLVPVVLLVFVFVVTFSDAYIRVMKNGYSQHIVATLVAVSLVTARILAVAEGVKREVNEGTTGFLFLTLGGLCVLSAVRYTAAVAAGLCTVTWYMIAAFIWRQDSMLNVASTVLTAFFALIVFVYVTRDFELSERRDFVLTSRLRDEKVDLNFKLEGFSLFQRATEKSTAKADFSKVVIDPDKIKMGTMLGRGGFGAVHRGEWLQTEVAIKVLNSEALKEEVMTEFHDEALMMSNMRHPNVVLFMGISIAPPMLVMEMMHRGSLYKIIHQDKVVMHWTLIVKMAMDAARGMNFLHTHSPPLVHRDLKSLNLLVARDWRVKVSDFGLTKLQKQNDVALKGEAAGGPGTLAWAAPEVMKDRPSVTAKSDVYSFGVVLYELVFRREPFKDAHANAIPFLVTEGKRPWTNEAQDVDDVCLEGLSTLMKKCCHEKPSRRPTFAEILRELDDLTRKHIKIESGTFDDHVQLPVKTNRRGSTIDAGSAISPVTAGQFSIQMKNIELGPKIGRGGNAVVYEGLYNGTHVAVKELFVKASQDELVKEFQKECQLMLNLRHPNIVLFMGSAANNGQLYMVTELMVNGSLFQIYHNQSRNKVSPRRRLRLSADTARGMQYLHSLSPPIIHRDLKSPNVLVTEHWQAKVADFGLSRYKDESKTMTTCGSPLWAAPEVLRGERFGEPCDVFSFAIIVWELMAWEEPYAGMDSMQVMTSVARSKLRPPMPDHVSPALKKLLEQMWDDDQHKRPTFATVLESLEDMIA